MTLERLLDYDSIKQLSKKQVIRYIYTTDDWCSKKSSLNIFPNANKALVVINISFVSWNPKADFTQNIKVRFYDGNKWTNIIKATGYSPLILNSDKVYSFNVGKLKILYISMIYYSSMLIRSSENEKLRFVVSDLITGADKFYAGCVVIQYKE